MIVASFLIAAPAALAVSGVESATGGLNTTAKQGYGVNDTTALYPPGGLSAIIGRIIGAVLSFVGVIFFILLIYAGFLWMFAMGNEEKVTHAKDMIFAAAIGLIVVLAAYAITTLVAGIFAGV